MRVRIGGGEVGEDVRDHAGGVVGRCGERGELQLVQVHRVEYVPSVLEEIKIQVRSAYFVRDGRENGTLIVSSQLNVASVMNRTMARVAHLVSGSLFGAVLLH